MTISSNKLDVSRFDGMKENESSFISGVNIRSSSLGKQFSETDNLRFSDVKNLPSRADSIRRHNQTHGETDINIKHLAQPGKGGFFNAIKNFFVGLFQSELQMPKTVMVTVAGETINVNGERFRGMIEALPKAEREGAVGALGDQITARLSNAEKLLRKVLAAERLGKATTQEVSDMMLFIQLSHVARYPNESFTNGVYSIEDPMGHLANFLDSCKEGYNRSSSHLEGLQNAPLGGAKKNAMRGIDIPGGVMTGLLDKRGTIHYGSIPKQGHVLNSTRRLFIKTERHGCRLSLRSFKFWTKSFWVNTSGRAHRFMRLSDIGRAICNCFEKTDEKSCINYRSEKVPGLSAKDVVKTFEGIGLCEKLEDLKPYFRKDGKKRLPENARLVETLKWLDDLEAIVDDPLGNLSAKQTIGKEEFTQFSRALNSIKTKFINGMYTDNPNQLKVHRNQTFSWLLTSNWLNQPDRLGNEMMMRLEDFIVGISRTKRDNNLPEEESDDEDWFLKPKG